MRRGRVQIEHLASRLDGWARRCRADTRASLNVRSRSPTDGADEAGYFGEAVENPPEVIQRDFDSRRPRPGIIHRRGRKIARRRQQSSRAIVGRRRSRRSSRSRGPVAPTPQGGRKHPTRISSSIDDDILFICGGLSRLDKLERRSEEHGRLLADVLRANAARAPISYGGRRSTSSRSG